MRGPARANGADESPLDLADLHITAGGAPDSVELSLTVDDPQLVPELRRRAQRELEHRSARR